MKKVNAVLMLEKNSWTLWKTVGSGLLLEANLACTIPYQECEKHRFIYSISHQQITDFIPIDQSCIILFKH
jgi:hypothetical protein